MNGESASEGRNDQEAGEILYVHTRPPLSPLSSALSPLPLSHCQASDIESPFFSEYRLFTLNFVRFFRRPRSNYDMRYSLSLPLFLSCGQRAGRQQGGGILGLWLASRSQKSTLPIHSPWTLPSCLEGDLGQRRGTSSHLFGLSPNLCHLSVLGQTTTFPPQKPLSRSLARPRRSPPRPCENCI